MKFTFWWRAALFVLAPLSSLHAQTYDSELNLGVEAYKQSRYEEAIAHFRKAIELGPTQTTSQMYLAAALASQYIPGIDSEDNQRIAEEAIQHYQRVLESDAPPNSRMNSAKGIGYLYLNMKKLPEAKSYYQRASGLDPKDPEPHYSIGVIDWTMCYQPRMEARAKLGHAAGPELESEEPRTKKSLRRFERPKHVDGGRGNREPAQGHRTWPGLRRCDGLHKFGVSREGRS